MKTIIAMYQNNDCGIRHFYVKEENLANFKSWARNNSYEIIRIDDSTSTDILRAYTIDRKWYFKNN
ncbi:MAG: hypothetical protein IKB70_08370 [Bacilli bacterium]|nr:hypothetical protein [Bacilli bacterium]